MIVFADSSAVVKLYADELDHELVRGQGSLVVLALARVEVPAAIWRKHRMGELDPGRRCAGRGARPAHLRRGAAGQCESRR